MANFLTHSQSLQQEAASEKTTSSRLQELAKVSVELARLVALNPNTSPEFLQKLGRSKDTIIRRNVAANPNTPTDLLWELGDQFPQVVINNPIFSLLGLENPNFWQQIPKETLLSLLKCETMPVFFLEQAANESDDELQMAVAMNPRTPKILLENLIKSQYSEVKQAVHLHVNIAGEMTSGWDEAARNAILTSGLKCTNQENIEKLASRGLIPRWMPQPIEKIAKTNDRDRNDPVSMAENPNTPINLLEQLAQDEALYIRRAVARNPNAPSHLLEKLAQDEIPYIRQAVAQNSNAPSHLLEKLAQDKESYIHEVVAQNSNAPSHLLEKLAQDQYSYTRACVAKNPNTPIDVLEKLAQDKDVHISEAIARNPNTPNHLLEQLLQDAEPRVRKSIAENPHLSVKILEELMQDENSNIRIAVAENPNLPINLLVRLVKDKDIYVRSFVAKNVNLSVTLLKQLAQDKNTLIRESVAKNPSTPNNILERLAQDEDNHLRRTAAENPNAPLHLFFKEMPCDAQNLTPCFFRFSLLLNSQIPAPTLAKNRRSPAWLERYAIAQNPNTPINTLKALVKDANRIVRAAAKANFQSRHQQS